MILLLLQILVSLNSAFAGEFLSCQAETMSSICGSESLKFNLIENNFSFLYGDIQCWHQDLNYRGKATLIKETSSLRTYSLRAEKLSHGSSNHIQEVDQTIATVEVDKNKNLIRLKLIEKFFPGGRGNHYHLNCSQEQKNCQQCYSQPFPDAFCNNNCNCQSSAFCGMW